MDFELKSIIDKLGSECRQALEAAAGLCVSQTHYNIEIEHMLAKLVERPGTDVEKLFKYYGIQTSAVSQELQRSLEKLKRGNSRTPVFSPQLIEALQDAWMIASLSMGMSAIRSSAVLLALITNDTMRRLALESVPSLKNIPRDTIQKDCKEIIKGSVEDGSTPKSAPLAEEAGERRASGGSSQYLDQYTVDLTAQAKAGKIDPVQGRDAEIRQIIDILMRRRQNNPILTGEAGVGKTAVVEGFALRVAAGDVPPPLQGISIRSLDMALLQAGAGVKGEFENRLKGVINDVKNSATPIILFIDEAHTLIGAGGQAGQGDAANLLKPALARGELRTIAATTWAEYKKFFEKDPALTRRFQVVKVEEPDEAKAISMVRGLVGYLEKHHNVRILDEAVCDAVKLSNRYIAGRQLPDKAISVIDTACARVAIGQNSTPPDMEDAGRRLNTLQAELDILQREELEGIDHKKRIDELREEIENLDREYEELAKHFERESSLIRQVRDIQKQVDACHATLIADPNNADAIKESERLNREIQKVETELSAVQEERKMIPINVDSESIAAVISAWTGIPIGKMVTDEVKSILTLSDTMHERVIGQQQALDMISKRIMTSRADLLDPEKPVGVFLLVGPSGVGKTETALTLADLLYGGERNLITINMSEFQEAHTVSSLKGAPPGYVGYGTGGVLTEAVRRNPYSVVLLDECEKAHPDVMELFYQVFDKGMMDDGEGVSVNFRNTVILLTSNLATEEIVRSCQEGEDRPEAEDLAEAIHPILVEHFKPALLGRMVVVPYYPLNSEEVARIVTLKLNKIRRRVRDNHGASFQWDAGVVEYVSARATQLDAGARAIDNILNNQLLPELSAEVLRKIASSTPFSEIKIGVAEEGNGFTYTFDNSVTEERSISL